MRSPVPAALMALAVALGLAPGCRSRANLEAEVEQLREEVVLVRWELDRLREDMWKDGAESAVLVAETRYVLGLPPGSSAGDPVATGARMWNPPAALGHLPDTPADERARIDDLVRLLFDPFAGRDSLDAKRALIALGKPAFPRVLGRMARARDELTDRDSHEERLQESSLKLADETLREMDGWVTAKGKATLRPGCTRDYVAYICRLHYKRWITSLRYLETMPGPFDPSRQYPGEVEEYG